MATDMYPYLFPAAKILTGNYGVEDLCKLVERSEASHLNQSILDHLIYMVVICHAARCYHVADQLKYNVEEAGNISELLESAKFIYLPGRIITYLNSIGHFKRSNGMEVVPWVSSRSRFYSPELGQLTPEMVLSRAGRPIPDNYWCLDHSWIKEWKKINAYKNVKVFLCVYNKGPSGSAEMLITPRTYHLVDAQKHERVVSEEIVPTSPDEIPEADARLGAVYNFRRMSEYSSWPADTKNVCLYGFKYRNFFPKDSADILFGRKS